MGRRGRGEGSGDLERVGDQFATWRSGRKAGERIPARLWEEAVKLATKHGVSRTATTLKLDYYSLKKRLDQREVRADSRSPGAAFVELPASISLPMAGEYSIELEDGRGASMRVTIKGGGVPDLIALSRSFWNAE
jgi:hypothetical protein